MSTNSTDTYLAIFLGTKARMDSWRAMPDAERKAKEEKGMAEWKAWMEKHKGAVLEVGGPLGKTKRIAKDGIADVRNDLGAFAVVRAPSHDAAAKMFEGHPHFTIFPGDAVEVMPVLPIPGA
jgi:hypothetical protein